MEPDSLFQSARWSNGFMATKKGSFGFTPVECLAHLASRRPVYRFKTQSIIWRAVRRRKDVSLVFRACDSQVRPDFEEGYIVDAREPSGAAEEISP